MSKVKNKQQTRRDAIYRLSAIATLMLAFAVSVK
jgi:hypothetical protein